MTRHAFCWAASMEGIDDLPCDLVAFIAERHGLQLSDSLELLTHWLDHYEPLRSMPKGGGRDQPLGISAAFGRAALSIAPAVPTFWLGTTFARR
jgi:hypothetical protein